MDNFIKYIKDTQSEMAHVKWPTSQQATVFTTLIISVSLFVALLLGLFDFIFSDVIVEGFFLR